MTESTTGAEIHQRSIPFRIPQRMRYVAFAITLSVAGMVVSHLLALSFREAHNVTSGFPTPYTAARLWLSGEPGANLQDWNWFRQKSAAFGFTSTDVFWGNPPSLSLLMVPIAWLPAPKARVVWVFGSLLAWFAGVEWLRRAVLPATDRLTAWLTGLSLVVVAAVYDPFHANLHLGQIYSVLFLLECVTCILWLRKHSFGAGIFAGAALALKGYGLQLIALAVLKKDRRLVSGAAASFTIMAGLASLRLGIHSWVDFLAVHLGDHSFSGTTVPSLQTFKSFAGVAMLPIYHPGGIPPVLNRTADVILTVLSLAVQVIVLLWLARNRISCRSGQPREAGSSPPSSFALAACIGSGLIFSPRAENHAYCLALAGLVLMMPALGRINLASVGTILAGVFLAWPFHFQARSVLDGIDLLESYPRLWGAVLVLVSALLAEKVYRRRSQALAKPTTRSASGIAWIAGLSLILFYVKPWRNPADGPVLIVSRTRANAISFFRMDLDEREAFSVPVGCTGPFGIALSQDHRWLYATCTDNSRLSIIDLRHRQEKRILEAPQLPAWAGSRPNASEVWISNEATGAVTIYESGNARLVAEVRTGNGPSDICFTADGKTAFVTNEASGTVSCIDASARRKIGDIAVGKIPQGLALTPDQRTLVVANYGSDAVSLVSVEQRRELARISTGRGPVDVAVSSAGGADLAYVSCFKDGVVAVLDLWRMQELTRLPVGSQILGISAPPGKDRIYVCSSGTDELVVLRGGARPGLLQRIPVPGSPSLVKFAP